MSVRQSLLAILDQGPCYGYQLRAEFERRTGSTWPLNVGQIYNTLDRLERDGLVEKGETDEHGHVFWRITDAGSTAARDWLQAPVERSTGTRDELAVKLAIAATLPGVDVAEVIGIERRACADHLDELVRLRDAGEGLARMLLLDALIFQADARVRWLDHVRERVAQHPLAPLGIDTERPRRGRPARTAVAG